MKNQKIRSMKVHEQSGYNYKAKINRLVDLRAAINAAIWLQLWIISNHTVETRNSFGIGRTGSLYVSIIIM